MKRNSNKICGRKTTTAPTPLMTPLTRRSLRSPGAINPPTQPPNVSSMLDRNSIGIFANEKMLWNIIAISPTKMTRPQTLCVNTASSRSLNVSRTTDSSVTVAAMRSAMRAYRASIAAVRQSTPAVSSRVRAAVTAEASSAG